MIVPLVLMSRHSLFRLSILIIVVPPLDVLPEGGTDGKRSTLNTVESLDPLSIRHHAATLVLQKKI